MLFKTKRTHIVKILLNLPLVLVGLFALLSLSTKLPIPGGYKLFTVMSGSMEPQIGVGSLILDKKELLYQICDVVTFEVPDSQTLVTHRITNVTNNSYIVKGDANDASDVSPIPREDVIGRVIISLPILGYLVVFSKTLPGITLFVIVPATLIIYTEVLRIKNETVRLMAERKKRRLTLLEKVEEEMGKEIIKLEKDAKKTEKWVEDKTRKKQWKL